MLEYLTDLPERDKALCLLVVTFVFAAIALCLYVRWVWWRGYKAGYQDESLRLQDEELKFAHRMMRLTNKLKGQEEENDEPVILPFPKK